MLGQRLEQRLVVDQRALVLIGELRGQADRPKQLALERQGAARRLALTQNLG